MKQVLLVFIGGGLGSVLRYFFGKWLNSVEQAIPYGTMLSNIIGSLLIGIVLGYIVKSTSVSQTQYLLLATGFCGGFTTFSAFAYENQVFLRNGDYTNFIFYTFGSLILGFSAVFLGIYLSKFI